MSAVRAGHPSPGGLYGRLVASTASWPLGLAVLALVAWVAAGAPAEALLPGGWLVLSFALVVTAAALLLLGDVLRRILPLHRAATHLPAPTPPSQAALRDALLAPDRVPIALVSVPAAWLLADALGAPGTSGLEGASGAGLRLLLLAALLGAATPLAVCVRRVIASWLSPFAAEEMLGPPRRGLSRPFGLQIALPTAAAAIAPAGIVLTPSPGGAHWLAVSLCLAGAGLAGAAAGVVAARLAARMEGEAARLRDRMSTGVAGSIAEVVELSTELSALAERFGDTASAEDSSRRSLEEMQRQKTLFMASMSHDLRSPLNSILGFSELLLSDVSGGLAPAQEESVRTVQRSGQDLLRLLNDVIDSARFDVGRLPLHRAWTPSVEILTEAVRQGRELIVGRPLEIAAELQPGLPPVYVDSERIVQAVVGIFRHASRAMQRGTIRLRAAVAIADEDGEAQVRVVIADQSQGIRAEDRERIFQAFREVAEPSGRRIGGLGLGLSLARSLVEAQGGHVFCESRERQGTTFTVALPVDGPAPDADPRG